MKIIQKLMITALILGLITASGCTLDWDFPYCDSLSCPDDDEDWEMAKEPADVTDEPDAEDTESTEDEEDAD